MVNIDWKFHNQIYSAMYKENQLEVVKNNDSWIAIINGFPCADHKVAMERLSDGYKLPFKIFTSVEDAKQFAINYIIESKINKFMIIPNIILKS